MYRITSQLCEVFDCTNQQLIEKGILEQFNTWLQANPDQYVSHNIETGEIINRKIANIFFGFYNKTCLKTIPD